MESLELKIPPPVVALLTGLLMWLASKLIAPVVVPFGLRVGVAVAIACIGAVIGVSAMVSFRRAKTTMNPIKPGTASLLVTDGVFRFTRNPMYLSLLLYLFAWAVYLSNWLPLLFLPPFVLYINRFQIAPEERTLSSLFEAQYAAYKGKVRRWL
ncbi:MULTISPECIES: isoprenylcysteine carboxylmethyltransferase family protein [unclassified Cupriavidus]|uniref:methyltransferase family protein n=1 Tax=unclassified Cupriavidus TaxID=2640874 RepID=UPI00041575A4|nr:MULTISPECIES: isoprenylcysteine carboxylmethyltransferase family protein [unclassified Cupriavidus]MBP0627633.1 isoprenylcysteine carboxylmethyltransferase family protein [Cupriavidus sp. AcVe19-1a]MBP0639278.1 isoprenylcysteine carboxylmethyltransferase family protein [Cupriavidus sp. AcVe19-6a]